MESIELNAEQSRACSLVFNERKNVLITGVAGTGKSTLLTVMKTMAIEKRIAFSITGTTGIAALNIGGMTIHSFSGIGLGTKTVDQLMPNLNNRAKKRIQETDILVIDEISMLNAEIFDLLDSVFRRVRNIPGLFGGVQIVAFGDFLQLGPVSKGKESHYAFESKIWQECEFETIHLTKTYRQTDEHFVRVLNKIRIGETDEEVDSTILACPYARSRLPDDINPTMLVSTNEEAERINRKKLGEISVKEESFSAEISGDEYREESFFKNSKCQKTLTLKIGAQVMCISNKWRDEHGIVNGSVGVVESFEEGIEVKFPEGYVTLEQTTWQIEEDGNVVFSVRQYPLILAYAITIHKSQGMTIPYLLCDLTRVFSESQVYVALSRAKTLDGLFVRGYSPDKVRANRKALSFYGIS